MIEILVAGTFYYLVSQAPPYYNELKILQVYSVYDECEKMRRSQKAFYPYLWFFCAPSELPSLKTLLTEKAQADEEQKAKIITRISETQLEYNIQLTELLKEIRAMLKKETK